MDAPLAPRTEPGRPPAPTQDDRARLARGLRFGLPLAIVFWAGIVVPAAWIAG